MTSDRTASEQIITHHLSDHHSVQGEREFVARTICALMSVEYHSMTLRDWFAGQALAGCGHLWYSNLKTPDPDPIVAKWCYEAELIRLRGEVERDAIAAAMVEAAGQFADLITFVMSYGDRQGVRWSDEARHE